MWYTSILYTYIVGCVGFKKMNKAIGRFLTLDFFPTNLTATWVVKGRAPITLSQVKGGHGIAWQSCSLFLCPRSSSMDSTREVIISTERKGGVEAVPVTDVKDISLALAVWEGLPLAAKPTDTWAASQTDAWDVPQITARKIKIINKKNGTSDRG